jgi:hypothetical protein
MGRFDLTGIRRFILISLILLVVLSFSYGALAEGSWNFNSQDVTPPSAVIVEPYLVSNTQRSARIYMNPWESEDPWKEEIAGVTEVSYYVKIAGLGGGPTEFTGSFQDSQRTVSIGGSIYYELDLYQSPHNWYTDPLNDFNLKIEISWPKGTGNADYTIHGLIPIPPVPEPSTCMLLSIGLIGIIGLTRIRRQ